MDPNACLERYLDARECGDYEEARYAAIDLRQWVNRGGFEPDWSPELKAEIMGLEYGRG